MLPQIDFVGIEPEVISELAKGRHARETLAAIKLRKECAAYNIAPVGEHKAMEGMGQPVLSIPKLAYDYWGRRLGYECWSDKGFRDEFKRDNPGARIESAGGTKVQVGYTGENRKVIKRYDSCK